MFCFPYIFATRVSRKWQSCLHKLQSLRRDFDAFPIKKTIRWQNFFASVAHIVNMIESLDDSIHDKRVIENIQEFTSQIWSLCCSHWGSKRPLKTRCVTWWVLCKCMTKEILECQLNFHKRKHVSRRETKISS